MLTRILRKLKNIADLYTDQFQSEGFRRFFAMLKEELEENYLDKIQDHLNELKFNNGVFISVQLGQGNEGTSYILRKFPQKKKWFQQTWLEKMPAYSFQISPRDEAGYRVLGKIKDRGLNLVANSLVQSADHIYSFITVLRLELAFYMSCLNLYQKL